MSPDIRVYGVVGGIVITVFLTVFLTKNRTRSFIIETILRASLGIDGFGNIISFFIHIFLADEIARSIGWQTGSPFQYEVAVANLAIGIISFMCFWRRDFYFPAVIAKSVFAGGAGIIHLLDLFATGNVSLGNAGAILYWDLIRPFLFIGFYVIYQRYYTTGVYTHSQNMANNLKK